jgi:hypothetical protein
MASSGFARRLPGLTNTLLSWGLIVFLAVLPFHLVVKKLVPDPLGTYWKEFLLVLLVLIWMAGGLLAHFASRREAAPISIESPRRSLALFRTALDRAVIFYLGLLLLRFLLDRSGLVGLWGLYISAMYLPLFWLVPAVLDRRPAWFNRLLVLLVVLGAVSALGGLAEFLLDRALWPSAETVLRQGFPDVYVYGTHLRRVYFVFDSPTTLANTLALLLPLALALVFLSAKTWGRLASGLAVFLMAACIVVTFSRGIWVAVLLSLLVMGAFALSLARREASTDLVLRQRKAIFYAPASLLVVGLAIGITAIFNSQRNGDQVAAVVELAPQAYYAVPIGQVHDELLQATPVFGQSVLQEWTLYDPILGRDDLRTVLYEHPSQSEKVEIIYRLQVPHQATLQFGIALSPQVWSPEHGDGASFQVYLAPADTPEHGRFAFTRYINPKSNPSDRRWRNFFVDLSPWAGQIVNLSLITDAGPVGDWSYDWAGWSELRVISITPTFFAGAERDQNPVLRHATSILDWTRDETNRDRLAAWSTGLSAWRSAPLWGQGLGSTGVAALRTHPEAAYVTESQVLKALTELGLPGLFVLAFLWFQIGRSGWQALKRVTDRSQQILLLGLLTSLLVVFIEGWVYQNLEVKQVNAYFWTLAGMLAFLSARRGTPSENA